MPPVAALRARSVRAHEASGVGQTLGAGRLRHRAVLARLEYRLPRPEPFPDQRGQPVVALRDRLRLLVGMTR